jgi:hypothetical protein
MIENGEVSVEENDREGSSEDAGVLGRFSLERRDASCATTSLSSSSRRLCTATGVTLRFAKELFRCSLSDLLAE